MEVDIGISSLGQDESTLEYVSSDTVAKRLDPLISPNDEKWVQKHKFFTERLESDTPVKDIIRENFTFHESRLLTPSDRNDIKELQAANAKRYKDLLDGRFKGVMDSLATRFTMMFFGLPAAPMEDTLKDIAMMMGMEMEKDPLYNVKPPLHFLTAHKHRNWGKDSLKGTEDPCYPIPWPREEPKEPTLGLRGGEASENEVRTTSDYIPKDETPASPDSHWCYLHGLNGRIPFVPGKWKSYSLVLRQLLRVAYTVEKSADHIMYTLIAFDLWGQKKPMYTHDTLPLTATSSAAEFLEGMSANSNYDNEEKDRYALFVQEGVVLEEEGPKMWQPREELLRDTVKIGRTLGTFLDREAISYAYLTFPKTEVEKFSIVNYCSQQFNAHFTAAMDVLFGKPLREIPSCSKYNHALFRLHNKKTPDSRPIPIVYGAMGLPQWAWELLHPLNNPGAEWMVECCWLEPKVRPLIMPNYYPRPNPHLIAQGRKDAADYEQSFGSICEIATEAFDIETTRKLGSLYVIEGDPFKTSSDVIDGVEVLPVRGNYCPESYANDCGNELKKLSTWYLTLHVSWRQGHCRMITASWRKEPYKVMPPLGSSVASLISAVNILLKKSGQKHDWKETDHILLKENVCFDARQVQDMDTPSYLIPPDADDDDWFRIRQSITSPEVTVRLVKKSEVDWTSCIDQSNIWGVRLGKLDITGLTRSGGRRAFLKRLELRDLEDAEVKPDAGYPSSRPESIASAADDEEIPDEPYSTKRTHAFQTPLLHRQAPARVISPTKAFYLTDADLYGGSEQDVGVWATQRPSYADHAPPKVFDEEAGPDTERPPSVISDGDTNIFDDSRDERGGGDGDDEEHGSDNGEQDYGDDPGDDGSGDGSGDGSDNESSDESDSDSDDEDEDDAARVEAISSDNNGMDPEEDDEAENVVTYLPGQSERPPWNVDNRNSGEDRERTWTEQPSVFYDPPDRPHTSGDATIPAAGPPIERIHRTSNNTLYFSGAAPTTTETVRAQDALFEARGMLKRRIMKCYFRNCDFTCRLDAVDEMERHIITTHTTMGCGFCFEPQWEHWERAQRIRHMREKHLGEFSRILATGYPRRESGVPNQGESSSRQAQNHHEHSQPEASGAGPSQRPVQQPPQPSGAAQNQPRQPAPVQRRPMPQLPPQPSDAASQTQPRASIPAPPSTPAQTQPRSNFSQGPVHNPFAQDRQPSLRDVQKGLGPRDVPFYGPNPDPKLDNPPRRIPSVVTAWYDLVGPREHEDPPMVCPAPNCLYRNFKNLGSRGVWRHFTEFHAIRDLKECPFCHLSFMEVKHHGPIGNRIWTYRKTEECITHLECHIYDLWRPEPEDGGEPSSDFRETLSVVGRNLDRDHATAPDSPQIWVRACPFFSQCGVVVNYSSKRLTEFYDHLQHSHPRDVQLLRSDDEDGGGRGDDDEDGRDDHGSGHDEDNGDDHGRRRQRSPSLGSPRRRPPPRPPTPAPTRTQFHFPEDEIREDEFTESGDSWQVVPREQSTAQKTGEKRKAAAPADQSESDVPSEVELTPRRRRSPRSAERTTNKTSKRRKPSPRSEESGSESDTDIHPNLSDNQRSSKAPQGGLGGSTRAAPKKKPSPKKPSCKDKSPAPPTESDNEGPSDAMKRGRGSVRKPQSKPAATSAAAAETQGSSSKSGATEGRGRSKKSKGKAPQKEGEEDGDYEDNEDETDDDEEEPDERGRARRSRSPNWVKRLGPGNPNFEPDDDMYCSKCLRKAPKRESKSPTRTPEQRKKEVKAHIDPRCCCRIRNEIGLAEDLPNRSGWIKGSDMPNKKDGGIGALRGKFQRRYPEYRKTMYPTLDIDRHATLWRSDPNNENNMGYWDIPWPPYEGRAPFPGSSWAPPPPDRSREDTPGSQGRKKIFTGVKVKDGPYHDAPDSDSGDSLKPDDPEIDDLGIEGSTNLKRPESALLQESIEVEGPAAKKQKTGSKTSKSGQKNRESSAGPSRQLTRLQRASASPAPPAATPEDVEDTGNEGQDDGDKTAKGGKKTTKGKEKESSAQPPRASRRIQERKASASSASMPPPSIAAASGAEDTDGGKITKRGNKTAAGKETAKPTRESSRVKQRTASASSGSMPPPFAAPASEKDVASDFEEMGGRIKANSRSRQASVASASASAAAESGREEAPKRGQKPKKQASAKPFRLPKARTPSVAGPSTAGPSTTGASKAGASKAGASKAKKPKDDDNENPEPSHKTTKAPTRRNVRAASAAAAAANDESQNDSSGAAKSGSKGKGKARQESAEPTRHSTRILERQASAPPAAATKDDESSDSDPDR